MFSWTDCSMSTTEAYWLSMGIFFGLNSLIFCSAGSLSVYRLQEDSIDWHSVFCPSFADSVGGNSRFKSSTTLCSSLEVLCWAVLVLMKWSEYLSGDSDILFLKSLFR